MAGRLASSDLGQLNAWPAETLQPDLGIYFQLSPDDGLFVSRYRTDRNRLGIALQLCCLRYLGFFPDDPLNPPEAAIAYVAGQLGISPEEIKGYGQRDKTRTQHRQKVLAHLSYRRAAPVDLLALEHWLLERALEHDQPKLLFELACDYLRRAKIVRPGASVLTRMVGAARARAETATFERLWPLLGGGLRRELDELVTPEVGAHARLSWLQRTPTSNKTSAIVQTLDKLAYLLELDVDHWDMSVLNPNRLKWLAKRGSRLKPHRMGRLKPEVRLPMLVAFLHEALYTFTDAVLEMLDQRLWELHNESKRAFQADRLAATKTINDTLEVLKTLGKLYLQSEAAPEPAARPPTREQVERALVRADHLIRPEKDAYVDYFAQRHRKVRNFSKRLLEVMHFESASPDGGLLEGLRLMKEIHDGTRRKLPQDAPTAFVPDTWRAEVWTDEGLNWRSYEIAALWMLRQRLRSGDTYTPHSRRHRELERYLIPRRDWPRLRPDTPGLTGTPLSADRRLEERCGVLQGLAASVEARLGEGADELRVEGERLRLSPLETELVTPELKRLRRQLEPRLPPVDITDVLIETDNLSSFSGDLTHLDGAPPQDKETLTYLYACLLAQACNLGFKQMAVSTDLSYERLLWCNRWYLRDDTLDRAVTTLVNYHHALPYSSVWGGGVLSSSDGQRFPVKSESRRARPLPRYFGYGKGVTAYTWTSDQFSQYGSKVIPSTLRDATYVLDAILDNETDLDILEHTTDTAGYTELIFALFGLLGLTFSPRIKDLADQQLYRPPGFALNVTNQLRPFLSSILDLDLIRRYWDEMLRVVMSIRTGFCTASLLVQKLQAYPRKHPVMRALQEYGRLEKTIFILRWYADLATRKRVSRQLNKGENLHRLRSRLFYGEFGEVQDQEDEALDQQVACLNLVTNVVVVYNTVHLSRAVDDLKREGATVRDEDLAHVWPSRFAHINILGKYHFDQTKMRLNRTA